MIPWSLKDFISEEFKKTLLGLRPQAFDLIFIRYAQLAYYFLTEKSLEDTLGKVIIDVDDVSTLVSERRIRAMRPGYEKLRSRLDLWFLKRYYRKMRRARMCLSTTEADSCYLLGEGFARRAHVVPNAVALADAGHGPRADKSFDLLFCGMLSFPHNEDAVVYFCERVLPMIRRQVPEAALKVIGKGPTPKLLGFDGRNGVSVIGPVPETKPYYERAAIAVVPMLNGAGTRIKILEAMAYRTPVVSTTLGAMGLDVQGGEHLLIADGPEAFAAECVRLLRDGALRRRLAENAYERVSTRYGERHFEQQVEQFLDQENLCPR